jgi:kumamolisin
MKITKLFRLAKHLKRASGLPFEFIKANSDDPGSIKLPPGVDATPVSETDEIKLSFRVNVPSGPREDYFKNRRSQIQLGAFPEPMTVAEYDRAFPCNQAQLEKVADTLTGHGIKVVRSVASLGEVYAVATVADFKKVVKFDLQVLEFNAQGKSMKVRANLRPAELINEEIKHIVTGIIGFESQLITHKNRILRDSNGLPARADSHAADNAWLPIDLARSFNTPLDELDKLGALAFAVRVGLVELGGGDRQTDFDLSCDMAKIAVNKRPKIERLLVDGATNSPDGVQGAQTEVELDEIACNFCGPNCTIVTAFSLNSSLGFVHGIDALVEALCDFISISWGRSEDFVTDAELQAFNLSTARANATGIVIVVASGDNLSTDNVDDGHNHADHPSSDSHTMSAGGLKIVRDRTVEPEVWNTGGNGTGGGVSDRFPQKDDQLLLSQPLPLHAETRNPGACVPDFAHTADPETGAIIVVDGQTIVIGGTSFSAPFIVAIFAVIMAIAGRRLNGLGTFLYKFGKEDGLFIDVVKGNNVGYQALVGFDCCTGQGIPRGDRILNSLRTRGFVTAEREKVLVEAGLALAS